MAPEHIPSFSFSFSPSNPIPFGLHFLLKAWTHQLQLPSITNDHIFILLTALPHFCSDNPAARTLAQAFRKNLTQTFHWKLTNWLFVLPEADSLCGFATGSQREPFHCQCCFTKASEERGRMCSANAGISSAEHMLGLLSRNGTSEMI